MNKKAAEFATWYKNSRNKFCTATYVDSSSRIRKITLPYTDWNTESVVKKESDFVIEALAKLKEKKIDKVSPSLMILTFNNRAEYISEQSDFYTTYTTLWTLSLAVVAGYLTSVVELKVLFAVFVLISAVLAIMQRFKLRTEVAINKEIVNLLKQYEAHHIPKT